MNKGMLLVGLVVVSLARGQGANGGFVMEAEGTRHLLSHVDPVYPPIAKAAHVQGSVLMHLDVNEQGEVTNAEAVGGPEMLRGAALEAVRKWSYKPFEVDGKPAAVKVVVSVPFSLGIPNATQKSDEAISQAYFPAENKCRAASASGKFTEAVQLCAEAVAIADRFPDAKLRANEIRSAHQAYAEALFSLGDLPASLMQCEKAVAIADTSLTAANAEYASVYFSRAMTEHASRKPVEAARDYRIAEDSYRKAIVELPGMTKQYSFSLARALAFDSVLQEQTGHEEESQKLRAEALRMDSHAMDVFGGPK